MITHMVLLAIRADVSEREIRDAFRELSALRGMVPGLLSFSGGAYSSSENLNQGFTHGFCMTFRDAAARDGYLAHPEHEKVKARVLPILEGGVAGVVAFDYES